MNINFSSDLFNVLRKIDQFPNKSQRALAKDLNMSIGKVNYCLKKLKEIGFLKIKNFNNHSNKIGYLYLLTPKGIANKTKITINFMKKKMEEYEELKVELKTTKKND